MKATPPHKTISEELSALFEADQAERIVGYENIDFKKMKENDTHRLVRAKEIYEDVKANALDLTGEELWKLAMLFQHSPHSADYLIAAQIADLSAKKGSKSGAWLSAAAEDRYLLNTGSKQKWGTQFTKESGEWEQMPMQSDEESGITDQMRIEKNVSPRDQQMAVFLARKDI